MRASYQSVWRTVSPVPSQITVGTTSAMHRADSCSSLISHWTSKISQEDPLLAEAPALAGRRKIYVQSGVKLVSRLLKNPG
jgi:hypothetical protein